MVVVDDNAPEPPPIEEDEGSSNDIFGRADCVDDVGVHPVLAHAAAHGAASSLESPKENESGDQREDDDGSHVESLPERVPEEEETAVDELD